MKAFIPSRALIMDIILFLLIGLFVYAAVNKLVDYDRFQATLGKSPLITKHATWIAIAVPGSEILISFMLMIPRFRLVGLYLSFMLMLLFTLYISFVLTFSPYVPCSCGGILNNMGWTEHLIFNIGYIIVALSGIFLYEPVNRHQVNSQIEPAL